MLPQTTKNFLDAVVNPFDAVNAAQVPDYSQYDSLCLTDYIDDFNVTNNSAGNATGALFTLHNGYSGLNNASSIVGLSYGMLQIAIDTSNHLIKNTGATFTSFLPTNYSTINGSTTSFSATASLVSGFRMFSMGLRVWPTIETITASATVGILNIWACQLTPNEILTCYTNSANIYNLARNSPDVLELTNHQGACSRYNPFQIKDQLAMNALGDTNDSDLDCSNQRMPVIVVQFTSNIATTAGFPVKVMAQFWMEGILSLPTPIYSIKSPVDIYYEQLSIAMSKQTIYPLTTGGHSFFSLATGLSAFMLFLQKTMEYSSHIANVVEYSQNPDQYIRNNNLYKREQSRYGINKPPGQRRPMKNSGYKKNLNMQGLIDNINKLIYPVYTDLSDKIVGYSLIYKNNIFVLLHLLSEPSAFVVYEGKRFSFFNKEHFALPPLFNIYTSTYNSLSEVVCKFIIDVEADNDIFAYSKAIPSILQMKDNKDTEDMKFNSTSFINVMTPGSCGTVFSFSGKIYALHLFFNNLDNCNYPLFFTKDMFLPYNKIIFDFIHSKHSVYSINKFSNFLPLIVKNFQIYFIHSSVSRSIHSLNHGRILLRGNDYQSIRNDHMLHLLIDRQQPVINPIKKTNLINEFRIVLEETVSKFLSIIDEDDEDQEYDDENVLDNYDGFEMQTSFSPCMTSFLNSVVNPFTQDPPTRIPDRCIDTSINLVDYIDTTIPITGGTDQSYTSFLLVPFIGYSAIITTLAVNDDAYGFLMLCFNATENYVNSVQITPTLYSTIVGSSSGVSLSAALIQDMRIFSMGMKVLPVVEYEIISTENQLEYYACQLTPREITDIVANTPKASNVIVNMPDTIQYAHNEGVSVRYNPFQTQLQLTSLNLNNFKSLAYDWATIQLPCIYVKMSLPVATASTALPFKIFVQYNIEGILNEPTPILPTTYEADVLFQQIAAFMGTQKTFPLSTKGYTFQDMTTRAYKIKKELSILSNNSSNILINKRVLIKKKRILRNLKNRIANKVIKRKSKILKNISKADLNNPNNKYFIGNEKHKNRKNKNKNKNKNNKNKKKRQNKIIPKIYRKKFKSNNNNGNRINKFNNKVVTLNRSKADKPSTQTFYVTGKRNNHKFRKNFQDQQNFETQTAFVERIPQAVDNILV